MISYRKHTEILQNDQGQYINNCHDLTILHNDHSLKRSSAAALGAFVLSVSLHLELKTFASMKIPTVSINKRKLKDRRVSIYLSYRPAITDPVTKKDHAFETLGIYLFNVVRWSHNNQEKCSVNAKKSFRNRVLCKILITFV